MTRQASAKMPWRIVVAISAAVALYTVSVMMAGGFTIDDAYISARYAKNLVASGQLTWNVGEHPRVEGYTSPLWVVMSSLVFSATDGFPFHLIQIMGVIFGVLTLLILFALARKLYASPWSAILPPLFLSVTLPFVLWSVSGMENSLYTFLVLLGLYLAIDEEDKGLRYLTPAVFFLIFLTRTEGLVFYVLLVAVRSVRYLPHMGSRRGDIEKFLTWNAIFLGCLSIYLLWKLYYYEALLPLPVHVKKTSGLLGFEYVMSFVVYVAPFMILALLGLRSAWGMSKIYLWGSLVAYLLAISLSNPLMGWDYRLVVAGFPIVYLLAVWELDRVFTGGSRNRATALLFGVTACFLVLTLIKGPESYAESLRSRARASAQVLERVHVPLGKWLEQQRSQAGPKTVALADVGAVTFYFNGDVIDFYGLNDRQIAYEGFSAQRVLSRRPDFVILNSKNSLRFEGNDSPCGKMSEEIFASDGFLEYYAVVKQFFSDKPFYSLWVCERIPGGGARK